jgi:hypothetical protein
MFLLFSGDTQRVSLGKKIDKLKFRRVLYVVLIAFRTMKLVVRSRHRKNGRGV